MKTLFTFIILLFVWINTKNVSVFATSVIASKSSTAVRNDDARKRIRKSGTSDRYSRQTLIQERRCRGGGCGSVITSEPTTISSSLPTLLNPFRTFVSLIHDSRQHLVAAAVARSLSIFGMYPVDTVKTRIQMAQSSPFRLSGLYGGVGGSMFGQVPYGVLTFGSYEIYKKSLRKRFPKARPILIYGLSAVLGDLTGSVWICPSEVIKQQLQAGMYKSSKEALAKIWASQGLRGLYQGYAGVVSRDVPFRVAQLTSYEAAKNLYLQLKSRRHRKHPSDVQLSPAETAICGAVAGTFSAFITCPLDRVKTLLMTDSAANGGTVLACVTRILREEGPAGMMKGILPRVAYIGPSATLFFIAYEKMQQQLRYW